MGVVVRRYIDFLIILLIPTPLVLALFLAAASLLPLFINPRRACAERVTVVILCVCVCTSVTHTLFWQYARLKV